MLSPFVIAQLLGVRFHACPSMSVCKQVRFPNSKKRRIRKKWRKRPQNWKTVPSSQVIQDGIDFYAHPAIIAKLTQGMRQVERAAPDTP